MSNAQPILNLLPTDSPEALILAHQQVSADACRRAGVTWRGEGVGLGSYTLKECETLTTLTGALHGDDAARMGAWQLVRAAYHECGRKAPPALARASGAREAPRGAMPASDGRPREVMLTSKGKPAVPVARHAWEGRTQEAPSLSLPDYMLATAIPTRAWEVAELAGPVPATLAGCNGVQLAALAGIRAQTPEGRAFVTRAQWCQRHLAGVMA